MQTAAYGICILTDISEAMKLGVTLGVDPQVLADIINSSTGRCWSSEVSTHLILESPEHRPSRGSKSCIQRKGPGWEFIFAVEDASGLLFVPCSSLRKRFQHTADITRQINHPVPEVKVANASPPAHRNYDGGFLTKLAHKDLALAVTAANQAGVPLEIGKRVEEVYRPLAKSAKFGNRDFSVVYEALGDLSTLDGAPKL